MSGSEPQVQGRLHAIAGSELTRIRVTDAELRPVQLPQNAGEIVLPLPAGIYQIDFVDADATETHLVALRPDADVAVEQGNKRAETSTLRRTASVPVAPQAAEAAGLRGQSDAELLVVVRGSAAVDGPYGADLAQGLTLADRAGAELSLEKLADFGADATGLRFKAGPGHWRLRLQTGVGDQVIEAPVVMCPGWATRVHLPVVPYGNRSNQRADLARAQVRMLDQGQQSLEDASLALRRESNALRAISEARDLRGEPFDRLLGELADSGSGSPMLAIYAGHLLALRIEARLKWHSGAERDASTGYRYRSRP